jgi:serine/threonine protein kinase
VLAPGTAVGRYRVVTVLGRGGMSTVYQATDEAAGRSVALKVLGPELEHDAEFVRRFRREGRLHASLTHAHVVAIYEAGESEWGLFLAMRLVRGPTLAALLADGALGGERASRCQAAERAGRRVRPRLPG